MKKSTAIKIISFCLAIGVILGGTAIFYAQKAQKYQEFILHMSDRAYSEIISSLSNAGAALEKMQYSAEGPYLNTLAAQVWREAASAKTGLSLLALGDVKLDQTERFIAQAGEYAYSILRRGLDDQATENVGALSVTANDLTQKLWQVKERVHQGEITLESLNSQGDMAQTGGGDSFSQIEKEFPQTGTLIYDGPFSDHLEKMSPVFLQGLPEIGEDEATKRAISFSKMEGLELVGQIGGTIPVYDFRTKDGGAIQITKVGGYTLQMTKPTTVDSAGLSIDEAIVKAKEFLASKGFDTMKDSYYTIFDNIVTINFAYSENDIIAYSDLIKVGIELGSGGVVSFEAKGYLMSHHERQLESPKITMEQAESKLAPGLMVESRNKAVVPTSGKNEVFCYEFVCKNQEGQDIVVYIDTKTGQEENMFVLIIDENGTLTI